MLKKLTNCVIMNSDLDTAVYNFEKIIMDTISRNFLSTGSRLSLYYPWCFNRFIVAVNKNKKSRHKFKSIGCEIDYDHFSFLRTEVKLILGADKLLRCENDPSNKPKNVWKYIYFMRMESSKGISSIIEGKMYCEYCRVCCRFGEYYESVY